jgi:hypothetical protein
MGFRAIYRQRRFYYYDDMSLASRFWRIQAVRSGAAVQVVHSADLWVCGVLISMFSYVRSIRVVWSCYEGCCAGVDLVSVV